MDGTGTGWWPPPRSPPSPAPTEPSESSESSPSHPPVDMSHLVHAASGVGCPEGALLQEMMEPEVKQQTINIRSTGLV